MDGWMDRYCFFDGGVGAVLCFLGEGRTLVFVSRDFLGRYIRCSCYFYGFALAWFCSFH